MNLSDTKLFGLKDCQHYGPGRDVTADSPYTRVQGREMQGVAFTEMSCLMAKMSLLATKPIVNLKILLTIHYRSRL